MVVKLVPIISILFFFVAPCLEMPEAVTGGVRKKECSMKFEKIDRKTPVTVSLF